MALRAGFLDLPAELRNQIYELVAATHPVRVRENAFLSRFTAFFPHPLMLACTQIRDEFSHFYDMTAPFVAPIEITCTDFNLCGLVGFLREFGAISEQSHISKDVCQHAETANNGVYRAEATGEDIDNRDNIAIINRRITIMIHLQRPEQHILSYLGPWLKYVRHNQTWLDGKDECCILLHRQLYRVIYKFSCAWNHHIGDKCSSVQNLMCGETSLFWGESFESRQILPILHSLVQSEHDRVLDARDLVEQRVDERAAEFAEWNKRCKHVIEYVGADENGYMMVRTNSG